MTRKGKKNADNPAQIYNEKRRIVLSTFNSDPEKARTYLEGYRGVLGPKGFKGLSAELAFLEQHERDFDLTSALDSGDAADFAGVIDGKAYRFDVTTNLDYKKLSKYEPFQSKGARYKIAVLDDGKFEIVDVNFPFCKHCQKGRVLPVAGLLKENFNDHGESQWSHDQVLIEICSDCQDYEITDRQTTFGLPDFGQWYAEQEAAQQASEKATI